MCLPPAKGQRVLGLGGAATHDGLSLVLSGGGLTSPTGGALTLSTANTVTGIAPNDHAISLKIAAATGLVTGGFSEGGRKVKLEALILPELPSQPLPLPKAWGFFLLPGAGSSAPVLSGEVFIGPIE